MPKGAVAPPLSSVLPPDWTERGSASEGFVIQFRGINQDYVDALEIIEFSHAARRENRRPKPSHSPRARLVAFLVMMPFLALTCLLCIVHFRGRGEDPFQLDPIPLALEVIAILGALALVAFALTRFSVRAKPARRSPEQAFTFDMTPKELILSGHKMETTVVPLASIDAFVGDARLSVRLRDGALVRFPAVLAGRDHDGLARVLNERLGELRVASSGYRGEGLRAPVDEPQAEDDRAAVEEAAIAEGLEQEAPKRTR